MSLLTADIFPTTHESTTASPDTYKESASKPCCTRFEEVTTFAELAEAAFSLDSEKIIARFRFDMPDDPENGEFESVVSWLSEDKKYNLDGWWIFDNNKKAHKLIDIIMKFNPDWQEGKSWMGTMTEAEKEQLIRKGWERAQDARAQRVAQKLGGKAVKLQTSSMEAGISSAVILREANPDEILLYRGVRNQEFDKVGEQVCGMLRTGTDAQGKDIISVVHAKMSTVIGDPEVREAVYLLASDPNEEGFQKLVEIFKSKGYEDKAEDANRALFYVHESMERNQGTLTFSEALARLHVSLHIGVNGYSPFVASAKDLVQTKDYSGQRGMIILSGVQPQRIAPVGLPNEVLVKGWFHSKDTRAVVPVNRFILPGYERGNDLEKIIDASFISAGKELEHFLKYKQQTERDSTQVKLA